jgi:hypothetical protein
LSNDATPFLLVEIEEIALLVITASGESHWQFGYFGRHYILAIPTDVIDPNWPEDKGKALGGRSW